jgi:hypothetical protein
MSKVRFRRSEGLLLALLSSAALSQAQETFLYEIPTAAGGRLPAGTEAVAVTLRLRQQPVLPHLGSPMPGAAGEFMLSFNVGGPYSALPGGVLDRHTKATFVVDFDERPVAELAAALGLERGGRTPIPAIVRATSGAVALTSAWGWLLASEVARRRAGDCTENAVLLTALARHAGWPARIVLGIELADDGRRAAAFGHAWAEIHDGRAWVLADATLRGSEPLRVRHVPVASLEDEGPGFRNDLARAIGSGWPLAVEIRAPQAPRP